MKEFTVEVKDKALSKALQEVAFENGYEWNNTGSKHPHNFNSWGLKFYPQKYITHGGFTNYDYTLPQDWNEVVVIISKPQFEIGDWVKYVGHPDQDNEHWNPDKNIVGKVKEISPKGKYQICDCLSLHNFSGSHNIALFRHATPLEIKEAQTKKFFKWDVKDLGGVYKIGCREVGKGDLSTILTELNALYNSFGKNPKLSEIIRELEIVTGDRL